jgi:tRNA (guanosine-2'-O-)-methyltransferase
MPGGGPKYEPAEREPPSPEELLLEVRKERIDQVIAGRTRSVVVVLDRLEDNFNMGAVVRTCEAMGLQELHVIDNPAHPFRPNQKVTQGCDKWVDLVVHPDFAACRAHLQGRGFSLWASAIREGSTSLFRLRFDQKLALVFGNERFGVSPEVLEGVDGYFWIPMRGFTQSLNVSAAVAATVSRVVSWREEHLGPRGDLTPEELEALRARFQLLSVKQRARIYGDSQP